MKRFLHNPRFYIIALAFLLSLFVIAYTRLHTVDDYLFYIRTGQLYALCAAVLLYVSILAGAFKRLMPFGRKTAGLWFCRPALLIAAAYFACLHVSITFFKQLGGFSNVGVLPSKYQLAAFLGLLSLTLLVVIGSFSAVKRLRAGWQNAINHGAYVAGMLIVVHASLVGPHLRKAPVRILAVSALAVLVCLEIMRYKRKQPAVKI